MANNRTQLPRRLPRVFRSGFGERLVGVFALMFDLLAEGTRQAVRAAWVGDRVIGPAADALPDLGDQRSLPAYPTETFDQHHARLQRAWIDWPAAGDESSILGQLAAAGFPGAVIYTKQSHPTMFASSDWSQFVVFYPLGTHTVTAPGPLWGAFLWGDGTAYGPVGITLEALNTIRSIVRKFKPGHWRCDGIIFEISGWTYGTGHTWGEVGLVYGGEIARVGA